MQCKPFFVLSLLSLWLWNALGKPNIVLIYTDDQGSVDAGCYGSEDLHTPAIDRLADRGIRFTNMYAPSAICSASRAGLLTGRIPTRAGVPGNVPSTKGQAGMPAAEIIDVAMDGIARRDAPVARIRVTLYVNVHPTILR